MRSEVTDNFELILHWEHHGDCQLRFAACSNCEFEVRGDLRFRSAMNYQGETGFVFETTCYAYALLHFAGELERFARDPSERGLFVGSYDLHLHARRNSPPKPLEVYDEHTEEWQRVVEGRKGAQDPKSWPEWEVELSYEAFQRGNFPWNAGPFVFRLGPLDDPAVCVRQIREVLEVFKMDTSADAEPLPPKR